MSGTRLGTTPSQTVGPYLSLGMVWLDGGEVVDGDLAGTITIEGRLLDGASEPVPDGVIETWQPDIAGASASRADGGTPGFGRSLTDAAGRWRIRTSKPEPILGPGGSMQAPHLAVSIFARGLLDRLVTRIYFADEAAANAADPVLAGLDERARATIIAAATAGHYEIEFHLQGDDETAFFTI